MIVKAFVPAFTLLTGLLCATAAGKLLLDPSYAQSIGVSSDAWIKAGVLSVAPLVIGGLALAGSLQTRLR